MEHTGTEVFSACAQRVVDYLSAHTPLTDWSVSRVNDGEQIQVHVHHGTLLAVGMRTAWPETFCSRMVAGAANLVPDSLADPDYRDLELAKHVRAYAGVPISATDGSLYGVLCGVSEQPTPEVEMPDGDLLQLLSGLLSAQVSLARRLDRDRHELEASRELNNVDQLTGLLNRRGWDGVVSQAQQRVDAYGDAVSVAVIDLDGLKSINDRSGHQAGDDVLRQAAGVLRRGVRVEDHLARYGGDEFAVLAEDVAASDLEPYYRRLVDALTQIGISASVGWATTGPGAQLADAFAEADRHMYAAKEQRRAVGDRRRPHLHAIGA